MLVDYKDFSNFENSKKVYIGVYAAEVLSNSNLCESDVEEIMNNCIQFYIELCDQILKRFDFESQYKSLNIIHPNLIVNGESNSILDIAKTFPNFLNENDKQIIDSEFRELQFLDFKSIFEGKETNFTEFWKKISEMKRCDSSLAFPILTNFIRNIMILPHSSANVERIFSQVNLNKTKVRNRLENDSLEGILYTKDYLKLKKSNCYDTEISSNLLKMLNSDIYT